MDSKIIIAMIEAIENPFLITGSLLFMFFITIYRVHLVLLFKRVVFKEQLQLKTHKVSYLKNHDVFAALKRATNEVKVMKFYTHGEYDETKTKMCYDFTKHKANHCGLKMSELVANSNMDTLPLDKLRVLITNSQNEMHVNYINAIRADWLSRGIPPLDVDHVVHLFEKFRYDVVNSFDHRIASVFGSGFHRTNFEIVLAIYDMWAMGVDLLPRDMNTTFESLNGKFKNIKY